MPESFKVSAVIPATPERIYKAWLDSREHSAMTGGKANIDPKVGSGFTAWDGYLWGKTIELEPYRRIVQSWRTTEFPTDSPDSRLEVLLEETKGGTRVTIVHTNIPDGQGDGYKQGWRDFYLKPMKAYFKAAT